MGKPFERVLGGDEFLPHETLVFNLQKSLHDGRIVNLLVLVQFATARITCGMNVANRIAALMDAAYYVTVHDLHVVNVEEKLHARRTDFLYDVHAVVDMIPLLTGMPLVGIGVVTGV